MSARSQVCSSPSRSVARSAPRVSTTPCWPAVEGSSRPLTCSSRVICRYSGASTTSAVSTIQASLRSFSRVPSLPM